jgi:hypothetical protein
MLSMAIFSMSLVVLHSQTKADDPWIGSFMQDQVITFFNPDLEHTESFMKAESVRVAAYIVSEAGDLRIVIESLGLELTQIRSIHPHLSRAEFQRRLKPFVEALNTEIKKKNEGIDLLRTKIVAYSAIAAGLFGLGLDFFWFKKSQERGAVKKKWKRPFCVAAGGCLCGALLGYLVSQRIGDQIQLMDEGEARFVLSDQDSEMARRPLRLP